MVAADASPKIKTPGSPVSIRDFRLFSVYTDRDSTVRFGVKISIFKYLELEDKDDEFTNYSLVILKIS
jgi:hypothetical protein